MQYDFLSFFFFGKEDNLEVLALVIMYKARYEWRSFLNFWTKVPCIH